MQCTAVTCLLRADPAHPSLAFFFFFFFGESFGLFLFSFFVLDELPAKTSTVLALPTQVCDQSFILLDELSAKALKMSPTHPGLRSLSFS